MADNLGMLGSAAEVAARNQRAQDDPQDAFLRFFANLYGVPAVRGIVGGVDTGRALVGGLEQGAKEATGEANKAFYVPDEYNAGPVTLQALGATVTPLVGPARGAAALGAGMARPAKTLARIGDNAAPGSAAWRAYADPAAPFPQYAFEYPEAGPPKMKMFKNVDEVTGEVTYKEGPSKQLTPEAETFKKARAKVMKQMDEEGFTPYFDPSKRKYVDPSNYPAANVDTRTLIPAKEETINRYLQGIDAPETRQLLEGAFARGQELGNADHWYAMAQLEREYIKELGAKAGRAAFLDQFAVPMAATTSGADPRANLMMAHYLENRRAQGLPIPTETHQLPFPVGGRYAGTNLENYAKMREGGGWSYLGPNQPKMHNFVRSFLGDLSGPVMDEQMVEGMLAHLYKPGMSKAEEKTVSKFIENARKTAYGFLEDPVNQMAAERGLYPGNIQDVTWAGFKNTPGKPMIQHINEAIERTHRLTGLSRDEIVRRGLVRKELPLYATGAVPIPTSGMVTEE